ncbi:MAG: GxxExxY protein [Planctomyces sp.]|nr:GxxExxY protein [Planctomyces sp.]
MSLVYPDESYAIMGACFEVYKELGCGFLESVYQEALAFEFQRRGVPHVPKPLVTIQYKQQELCQRYQPDFVCYGRIIVELKAVAELSDILRAQVHNYLRATAMKLGLLVNFAAHPKLESERIVR